MTAVPRRAPCGAGSDDPADAGRAGRIRLTYNRLARFGDVAYVAGHGPTYGDGWGSPLGKVGREVTVAEAVAAAQLTALNVLGTIERELGGLDTVARWLKINGYVNAVDGFTEHATVINGFSDLVVDLYGHDSLGARTSVGVPHRPLSRRSSGVASCGSTTRRTPPARTAG